MKVFPYVLTRWAGGAHDAFRELELKDVVALAEKIVAAESSLAVLADSVCSTLHVLVPRAGSAKLRAEFLALKRDIFNSRPVTRERWQDLTLPPEATLEFERWFAAAQDLTTLRQAVTEAFAAEIIVSRGHLQQLAASPQFLHGLLLASPDLCESVGSYLATRWQGDPPVSRTGLRIEMGLIKYLSRFHAKTSPFSTFTTLSLGSLESIPAPVSLEGEVGKVRSHVRLNAYIFYNLRRRLGAMREVRERLSLCLNPTVRWVEQQLAFLVNENNIESFQHISRHPLVELLLSDLSGISRPRGEIVARWLDFVDAPAEVLEEFLDRLLDLGFLEVDFCVSGLDPEWDVRLEAQLGELAPDIATASRLRERLKTLRNLALNYELADLVGRREHLQSLQAEVAKLLQDVGIESDLQRTLEEEVPSKEEGFVFTRQALPDMSFGSTNLLFEDAEECIPLTLSQELLADLACRLDTLAGELALFDWAANERAQLLAFCRQKYSESTANPDGGEVGLLRLYEDYYRDFKLPEKEGRLQEVGTGTGEAATAVQAILRARESRSAAMRSWLAAVRAAVSENALCDSVAIHVGSEHLRAGGAPRLPAERSLGCFLQLTFPEEGDPVGVLHHSVLLPGYGKSMSRFLQLFDPAVITALRAENRLLHADSLSVENCDGSFFNANLHPPLLDWEVSLPGSQNALPPEQRIPVSRLRVRWEDDDLRLEQAPTGQSVKVFDLGFQTNGRSPLFQLLQIFTPVSTLSFYPLLKVASEVWNEKRSAETSQRDQVRHLPRIVFADRLVLQRRKWLIPKALLPRWERIAGEGAAFLELQRWRLRYGLPERVFITIKTEEGATAGDASKPQYISFSNPFLVRLFYKLMPLVKAALTIEEMLPAPGDLMRIAGSSRVTELAFHWYCSPSKEDR